MNNEDIQLELKNEINKRFSQEVLIFKKLESNNNRLYLSLSSLIIQIVLSGVMLIISNYNQYMLALNIIFLFFTIYNYITIKNYIKNRKIKTDKINLKLSNVVKFAKERKDGIESKLLNKLVVQTLLMLIVIYSVVVLYNDGILNEVSQPVLQIILISWLISLIIIFKENEFSVIHEADKSLYKLMNFEKLETNKILDEMGFSVKEMKSTLYIKKQTA